MKASTQDLLQAGLDEGQISILRLQHSHLRSEGRPAELTKLAMRSRFVGVESLEQTTDASEGGESISDSYKLQTIIPLDLCKRFLCVPLEYTKGILYLRCAQPLNESQRKRIVELLAPRVKVLQILPASRQEISEVLNRIEQSGSVGGLIAAMKQDGLDAGRLRSLVYAVLKEALSLRASDIHLARKSDPDAWIAYRVDSQIRQMHLLPELLMQSLVARIKIEAGMDASNSRTAQDGRIALDHEGRVVDFRISTQPLVDGESVVLRALDASLLPSLGALFPAQPEMVDLVRGITAQSGKVGGIVLISGATGSGKSTTQYTMACGFRRDSMNVITVEDPVEYILPFAKQIQLQALIKQRAIELERSILRQDPDILIFGEIRDADSARAALAFAESGHTVITTLHANGVVQVPERFLSLVDVHHRNDAEFLLAHFLKVIIHQRLIRRLCVCAVPLSEPEFEHCDLQMQRATGGLINASPGMKKAVGCPRCNGTGYSGRVVAHETLKVIDNDDGRARFVHAFKQGDLVLPCNLNAEHGVHHVSRLQTYDVLLKHGVVDWPTVRLAMGVGADA
ncbi:GspE/PulE family protein [Limnobacter sp.]|uniref:GspE/PulE family protein n=1 Tax=Limnobacter sp. TaxID=2003368 RepID=UPI00351466B1